MIDGFFTFEVLSAIWAGLSLSALIAGLAKWDPVGRVGGTGIGPRVNSRWGWFVMEIPALLTFPVIYYLSPHHHFCRQYSGRYVGRALRPSNAYMAVDCSKTR